MGNRSGFVVAIGRLIKRLMPTQPMSVPSATVPTAPNCCGSSAKDSCGAVLPAELIGPARVSEAKGARWKLRGKKDRIAELKFAMLNNLIKASGMSSGTTKCESHSSQKVTLHPFALILS